VNNQTNDLKSILKSANQSLTSSRQLVFNSLKLHDPLSMSELVKLCLNEVDRATVYRVIKLYEDLGIVQRVPVGWKYKLELSEKFSHHHHHLTCLNCSKIIDITPPENIELDIMRLAKDYGFEVRSHQIEISGVCKDCVKK
jgi:Fur family ferric uptake transcriptional regulator